MRVAYKHAHELLETAYEATLISCSSGEVKLENLLGFELAVTGLQFAVRH